MIKGIKRELKEFFGYLVSKKLGYRYNPKNLDKKFQGKTVFCIGTGPSLDLVDFSSLNTQNQGIILVNGSIDIINAIQHRQSDVAWFSQDAKRIKELHSKVPENIQKIISINMYRRATICAQALKKGDVYLHPRRAAGKKYRADRLGLDDGFIPIDFEKPFLPAPYTGMISAIRLAASMGSKRIITIGFDLGYSTPNISENHDQPFPLDVVSLYLDRLSDSLDKKNIEIFNASPLRRENVLMEIPLSALRQER